MKTIKDLAQGTVIGKEESFTFNLQRFVVGKTEETGTTTSSGDFVSFGFYTEITNEATGETDRIKSHTLVAPSSREMQYKTKYFIPSKEELNEILHVASDECNQAINSMLAANY